MYLKQNSLMLRCFHILLPMGLGFLVTSIYRTIIAIQVQPLGAQFHLSAVALALIGAAYFLAFALFQIPLGIFLDRYGVRNTQSILFLLAVLGSLLFSMTHSVLGLFFSRVLIGIGVSGGLMAAYKANAEWFSEKLALANGFIAGVGGLGALLAASPAHYLIDHWGWRTVNFGLAVLTLLIAILTFLLVPKQHPGQLKNVSLMSYINGLAHVYGDRFFWQIALLPVFGFGFFITLQALWAAPFLQTVAGLDPTRVAHILTWMALGFSVGMVGFGYWVGKLIHDKYRLFRVIALSTLVSLISQACVFIDPAHLGIVFWFIYAIVSQSAALTFSIASKHYPKIYAGRVNTGLNMLLFLAVFFFQYLIGALVKLHLSHVYAWVFAIFIVLQLLALGGFSRAMRRYQQQF